MNTMDTMNTKRSFNRNRNHNHNRIITLLLTLAAGLLTATSSALADPCDGVPRAYSTITMTCTKVVIPGALPTDPAYVHIVASSSDPTLDKLTIVIGFNPDLLGGAAPAGVSSVRIQSDAGVVGPLQEPTVSFDAQQFPRPLKLDKVVAVPVGYVVLSVVCQEYRLLSSTGFGE